MGIPGYGYGIRYEYGMFHQGIENGQQVEHPDNWLRYGNPWEFPRPEVLYQVKFHGRVVDYADEHGNQRYQWVDTDDVMAMALGFVAVFGLFEFEFLEFFLALLFAGRRLAVPR